MSAAREIRELGSLPETAEGASSSRYETHTAVAVLCSELAHELAPALAFLRDVVRSKLLAEVDHSIAEEEVARLEAVVAALRRTKRREEATATLEFGAVAARAARRVREEGYAGERVALEIPPGLRVVASERGLELLLVSLLRNALRAARRAPAVVRARPGREAGSWCLEVEDDGEGLAEGLEDRLFVPLATLAAAGKGTGIPTVLRIARYYGWEVEYSRCAGHTLLTVHFNQNDTSIASQP